MGNKKILIVDDDPDVLQSMHVRLKANHYDTFFAADAISCMAEARKNNWTMAVAVVDTDGNLIYFEKMDNTQNASSNIAIEKARSAAVLKRPTKALQDALAAGGDGLRILALPGALPVEGGLPLIVDGKIIGAIGVSGEQSSQDAQCAQAGANILK